MSTLVPESEATAQLLRDQVTSAYRPESLAALRQLAGDGDNALVIDQLVKRFEKGGGLLAGLKQRFRRHDATPDPTNRPKVVRAVDNISLTIKRREIYGVLGSNGSGKSTLIRVISTLLLPDSGRVEVFGHDVEREPLAVQRLINRVSVEAAFFRKLSPMENLIFAARLYNLAIPAAKAQIQSLLGQLGIKPERYHQPLEDMSRGMQQKVAITRAFLTAPVLLLLDEPTTGLDPRSKQDVQRFVTMLRDTHDATVLLTTHDMDEAEAMCDRIAIIDGGRIVAEDTPVGLKARVGREMSLPEPATMNQVFLHFTGRDWENDENDDEGE